MTDTRSMTLLNKLGDIEISWDASKDAEMRLVIEKKMAEGVRFFILKPVLGTNFYKRKKLKKIEKLNTNHVKIDDADIEKMFTAGDVDLYRRSDGGTLETVGIARTADEVVKNTTVGVKAVAGG